jgi:hypothetical protein
MSSLDPNTPLPPMEESLPGCCQETMRLHGTHNMMLMCPTCKTVIKCFLDEKSFRAYLTFCQSRHRRVKPYRSNEMLMITFSSYDTR